MAKSAATLFGASLMCLGVLGFSGSAFIGSRAIFETDAMLNVVHFMFGSLLLIIAVWLPQFSMFWLKTVGIVCLTLAILGLLLAPERGYVLGLMLMNTADHWLHMTLGALLILTGIPSRYTLVWNAARTIFPTNFVKLYVKKIRSVYSDRYLTKS